VAWSAGTIRKIIPVTNEIPDGESQNAPVRPRRKWSTCSDRWQKNSPASHRSTRPAAIRASPPPDREQQALDQQLRIIWPRLRPARVAQRSLSAARWPGQSADSRRVRQAITAPGRRSPYSTAGSWRTARADTIFPSTRNQVDPHAQESLLGLRRGLARNSLSCTHFQHLVHEGLQLALACSTVTPGFIRP